MATTTPNLGLIKPDPGGDDDAWDVMLNSNADILDAAVQDAAEAAAAANANANTRLSSSLVSAFATALLNDATAATARATLGALAASAVSGFGLTLVDDTSAAAARVTLGAPTMPSTASGPGLLTFINPGTGNTAVLLPGGTWMWFLIFIATGAGGIFAGAAAGVSAGGSTIGGAVANHTWYGYAWRVA